MILLTVISSVTTGDHMLTSHTFRLSLQCKRLVSRLRKELCGRKSGGVGHASPEVFDKSALFTLRNSETTPWSKVKGVGFHKKARKVGSLYQLPSD